MKIHFRHDFFAMSDPVNDQSLAFEGGYKTPSGSGDKQSANATISTPSTLDMGSSGNSLDCSTDSIHATDPAESVQGHGNIFESYFDDSSDFTPNEPPAHTTGLGDLTSASAALLDPNILRMFVDSLSRSITGNVSNSILSDDESSNPISASIRGSLDEATPLVEGQPDTPPAAPMVSEFQRSVTNLSVLSSQTTTETSTSSTVMLRNVPYDSRQRGVLSLIEDEGFKGRFDFFYAPLDFKSKNNLGYAFVNFHSVDIAKEFFRHFDGRRIVSRPGWDKPLRVCWARVQGLEANVDHYRNSPVNEMPEEFKPMLFDENGDFLLFPPPDPATGPVEMRSNSRSSASLGGSTVRPRERRLQSQISRGFFTPNNSSISSLTSSVLTSTPPQMSANKLFVGGLAAETSSEALAEYMKKFGPVRDCHVLVDASTGRSRCYGFCTFEDTDSTRVALEYSKPHWLDGRGVVVRPYTSSTGPVRN